MSRLTVIILFVWLISCGQGQSPNEIIIEGHVKNIPDGKVYLTEAHYGNVFLDSTVATNGHFRFTIKPKSSFFPYMASICFPDSTSRNETKTRQLFYANEFNIPKGSAKGGYSYNSGFYLEKGITQIYDEISSKKSSDPLVKIRAGRENELLYKDEIRGFGWLGQPTLTKRSARIDLFKKHIEDHPYSYFLLQNIFDAKNQYSEQELSELLSLFDEDVQNSALGNKVRNYLVLRNDPGTPVTNLLLTSSEKEQHYVIDKQAKLNMLIFWASWCKGCREEILIFKEIHTRYTGKSINMASISIDEHADRWYKAMEQEQMRWPQYIVDPDQIETVRQQYNFTAIPLIVFTDSNGREIKRFLGNKSNSSTLYVNVIDTVLLRESSSP